MTSCPSEEDLVLFVEDALDRDAANAVGDHLTGCADCRRLVARSEAALRYALGGVADRERVLVERRVSTPRREILARREDPLGSGPGARFAVPRRGIFARREDPLGSGPGARFATPRRGIFAKREDPLGSGPRARVSTPLRRIPWRTIAAAAAVLAALGVIAETVRRSPSARDVDVASPATTHVTLPRTLSFDERLDELLARADRLAAPRPDEVTDDAALAALAAAEARVELGLPTAAARFQDVVDRFPGTPEAREARARIAMLGGGR